MVTINEIRFDTGFIEIFFFSFYFSRTFIVSEAVKRSIYCALKKSCGFFISVVFVSIYAEIV